MKSFAHSFSNKIREARKGLLRMVLSKFGDSHVFRTEAMENTEASVREFRENHGEGFQNETVPFRILPQTILALFCALATQTVVAQDFAIRRVEREGDLVNVYYDLRDSTARRTYTINLFSSRDNFISPLEKVTGDLGLEVRPGENRKITWNARQELTDTFEGEVGLEIRGRVYIPFVRLDGQYTTIKRMKPYEMTWTGGTQQNILNFDLYKDGEKITSFPNIANVGHYTLTLPSSVKPGKGYSFKITDTKNKDQIVNSSAFSVKRKVPLLVKALPVALVGGVLYWLVTRPETASPGIPGIPEAPGNPGQ